MSHSNPALQIRPAAPADCDVIVDFNLRLAEESERLSLGRERVSLGVAALLADATKGRYWLAEIDGRIVGQVMHTWEWSDWRNGFFWWIQSVYVVPEQRGRGVFRALHQHVRELARADAQVIGLRLYVEEHNQPALATYHRLGMETSGYRVMQEEFITPVSL
jgi:ribosomal protein S18 acetylase RimI-like enzyme